MGLSNDARREKLKLAMRLVDECEPGDDHDDGDYEFGWLTGISISIREFIKHRLPDKDNHGRR